MACIQSFCFLGPWAMGIIQRKTVSYNSSLYRMTQRDDNGWNLHNDESVRPLTNNEFEQRKKSEQPMILFYRKK